MPSIWLIKDSEPLPIDNNPRLFRTGLVAEELVRRGYDVVWFTSRFEHKQKQLRSQSGTVSVNEKLKLVLLEGSSYSRNISWNRIKHQKLVANNFSSIAPTFPRPDVIVAAYPSPELCLAASKFAKQKSIPIFVDARDPWPDSFAEFFPALLRPALLPVLAQYRKALRESASNAHGVLSMSNSMLKWALGYANRPPSERDAVFYMGFSDAPTKAAKEIPTNFTKENPLHCVFAGNFTQSYDGPLLIKAMRRLSKAGIDNIHCTLVGDGTDCAKWKELAEGLTNVTFAGWMGKDALNKVLSSCHIGLIPIRGGNSSFWMGNRLGEYTAHSLAVINTSSGDARPLVAAEQIGLNIPQSSVDALEEGLKLYVNNPPLLQQHCTNARAVFEKFFNAEQIFGNYVDHITQPLAPREKANGVVGYSS